MITYTGPMIVYFNRHSDAPRVWCVADPERNWELQVKSVIINAPIETHYAGPLQQPNHEGPPSAIMKLSGALVVSNEGHATIEEA